MKKSRLATDQRRAQLLELGVTLFSEHSYEDVSIDFIAEEAGVSKGLLYHYFGGKRAFYLASLEVSAARLRETVRPQPELSPAERAKAGLVAYLDFVEQKGTAYASLMNGGLGGDPGVVEVIDSSRKAIIGQILNDMGVGLKHPVFVMAATAWIGAVEAAALRWLETRDMDRDQLVQLLLANLFVTMLAAASLDPTADVDLDIAAGAQVLGFVPAGLG